ncbi:DUF6754 domain-containing protein [Candidatus Zixiibacteriota bacterium]
MRKVLTIFLFLPVFFAFYGISTTWAQAEPPAEVLDTIVIDTTDVAPKLEPPAAVGAVTAKDTPDDAGKSITVSWELSPDDDGGRQNVAKYIVLRATTPDGPLDTVGSATAGMNSVSDGQVENGVDYYYQVVALASELTPAGDELFAGTPSRLSGAAQASGQWFHVIRTARIFPWVLVIGISVLWFIKVAKKGKDLYVRPIAGLAEVEQAVGRATEMGRKLVYVPGTQDMDNVQTLAGVTILGRIAKLAAEYDAQLDVPVARSLVMITAREVVKEAYLNIGRPDAFNEDMVRYITDDQFGYAAALDGLFVREKPATIFYMGAFYAESLILAETGNAIGAIQIAGTAMPAQLPFFVAACDYTLIGEELFAASAYLSKEPKLLGSLKGQDVAKVLILIAAILGLILATADVADISWWFQV